MLGYDLKQAFEYFFKSENLIGIILLFVISIVFCAISIIPLNQAVATPEVSIFMLIAMVLISIIMFGFFCTLVNQRIHKPNLNYYIINFKKLFLTGIKASAPLFVGSMIIIPIGTIIAIPIALQYTGGGVGAIVALIIAFFVGVVLSLLVVSIYFLMLNIFTIDLKLKSLFNLKAMKFLYINNFKECLKVSAVLIIFSIVSSIINAISSITVIIPAIIFAITIVIIADIQAQFIRKAFNIGQGKANG